jgi:hypothetical protein
VERTAEADGSPLIRERIQASLGELDAAMTELRELARGIHPAILDEEGLGPALTSLAERAAVPVELTVELSERLPTAVEVTAYFVVAEALTNTLGTPMPRRRRSARRSPTASSTCASTTTGRAAPTLSRGPDYEALRTG